MPDKKGIVVDVKFKDLRDAIAALNESGLLAEKIKLVGFTKEVLLDKFMKSVEGIEDVDGKFPGPKIAIDFFNEIVDKEEKAAKKETKEAEKAEKGEGDPEKGTDAPAKPKTTKPKAPKKEKEAGEPKITKKSIVVKGVQKKGGSTIEEMATGCTEAGLGDQETNVKTVGLWLKKLGFPVKKNDKGKWEEA